MENRTVLTSTERWSLRIVAVVLSFLTVVVFAPLWSAVILAAWFAGLTRPLLTKLTRMFGGRYWAGTAAALTTLLVLAFILPALFLFVALAGDAVDLVRRVLASRGGRDALQAIVSGDGANHDVSVARVTAAQVFLWVKQYGENAWNLAQTVAGAAAGVLLWFFLFLTGSYTFLVHGPSSYGWLQERSPLARPHLHRFVLAFHETGRGLLIGVGLTALAQGIASAIAYLLLGVPRALVLGLLTCFAALIPSMGTAFIWVPVAAGLAYSGRQTEALLLIGIGIIVIGSLDNILRPFLSRFGELRLSGFVLLLAMFGGLAILGAWGLVLGPLIVRLAVEALDILREEKAAVASVNLAVEGIPFGVIVNDPRLF